MNVPGVKKGLVVVIVLLFFGTAAAPAIHTNINKTSSEHSLVEISTEIHGIEGAKPYSVKLPKQKVLELEMLFDEIKRKLNNSITPQETTEIFNEAIVELDKHGLLPNNTDVKEVQKLVTGGINDAMILELFEKTYPENYKPVFKGNLLCFIAGKTTRTYYGRLALGVLAILLMNLPYSDIPPLPIVLCALFIVLGTLTVLSLTLSLIPWIICSIFKIGLREFMTFGEYIMPGRFPIPVPARGWIWSLGLLGIKNWSDSFYGNLYHGALFIGASGFTGIRIHIEGTSYLLGFALRVRMSYDS